MNPLHRCRAAARPSARRFALLSATAVAVLLPLSADAQRLLEGRVVRAGEGVSGVPVELHRVTAAEQGVAASSITGPAGSFRLPRPELDTASFAVVFATAVVDGVRYFGPALHPGDRPGEYRISVFDTTSSAAALDSLRVARRDVFLFPRVEGGWEVTELVVVENPAGRTVVGEGGMPAFGLPLPDGATDLRTGLDDNGAAAGQELVLMRGRVLLTAPLVPGSREMFFRYLLPEGEGGISLPVGRSTDSLAVYLPRSAPQVEIAGLGAGQPFALEGEEFLRFTGASLPADARVGVKWRRPARAPVDPRWAALVVAGGVLVVGTVRALGRRSPSA